jgi:1-acyl-sn-glycerol-3-phosphate acyltransferase
MRAAFKMRFSGLDRVPERGAAILAPNHVSVLDPIAVALAVAERGRVIRFLAAAEFFSHPLLGPGLRVTHQIPIRRGIRDLAALDDLVGVIRDGHLAGIFPEGRIRSGNPPLKGLSGLARIAQATGAPVIPVGVWGTRDRWPPGKPRLRPLRRLPLTVVMGEPVTVDPSASSGGGLKEATIRIMSAIEERMNEARAMTNRPGWGSR